MCPQTSDVLTKTIIMSCRQEIEQQRHLLVTVRTKKNAKNISVICQNKKGKNHLFTSRTGFEHVIKLLNIYIQKHLLLSMNHFELCVKKCFNILPATDIMMWSLVGRQINDLSLKSVKRSPLISALFHIFDWW